MAECDRHRFSGLELLPTPMLEKIIEQDFKQEADYDPELIDYVLALMVQRAKSEDPHSIPNMQSSWNKLQQRLDGEVELGPLPFRTIPTEKIRKSSRVRPFLRYVAVVAACIAIIFGAMITVQAMGVDVFGVLAEWTDSTFRFDPMREEITDTAPTLNCVEEVLGQALSEMNMPTSLAPTWIPQDYNLVNVGRRETKEFKKVYAMYTNSCNKKTISFEFEEVPVDSYFTDIIYEKSAGAPDIYKKGALQFYIFENSGTWTGTWHNAKFCVTIAGAESKEIIISIINSIQENNYV